MPNQVIPLTQLDKTGLIMDMPSVSLPPNAFSDVQNVRFDDGAVSKFPGETSELTLTNILYTAHWPAPSGSKHVVVIADDATTVTIRVYDEDFTSPSTELEGGDMDITGVGEWQHTIFNGGFHIILNNGTSTPTFLQDGITGIQELPGWDSYAAEEVLMNFESDGSTNFIPVDTTISVGTNIKVSNIPRNVGLPIYTETVEISAAVQTDVDNGAATAVGDPILSDGTLANIGTIDEVDTEGFIFTPNLDTGGNTFRIAIVSDPVTTVTAGVVRAYGNLLVAGNLRESDGRVLTGTVRTSDVAGPGEVPTNWNPFQLGVNTADEFVLASTGTIQDMVELQGVLYVYTDSSIHSIQQTGSPIIPFQISPITDNYGVDRTGGVLEVDGKHIVCGSNDVYVFAGHPGSISSIADGRVRNSVTDMKIVRFNKYDELWFYNTTGVQYIWDYRNNVWTKRSGTAVTSLNSGVGDLLLSTTAGISGVDSVNYLNDAYVERKRLAMSPEFDTETLASIAMLADGGSELTVHARGTNAPGNEDTITDMNSSTFTFDTGADGDYKTDIRVHGRFLNYRIGDMDTVNNWRLSGLQFDISKGGQR